jgi:hypothetical protein
LANATDEPLSKYVRQFEEAERQSLTGRRESEKARDYYDGRQIDAEQEAALKKRKQPIIHENIIKEKVETLCGIERQARVDPIAYPRVPQKEPDANAATDALRYVEQDQDLDIKKSRVFENMLIEGLGGVEVTVRQLKNGTIDPLVVQIAWDRIYADPHSCEADYSDASYTGYITWMDADVALKRWPDKKDVIESTMQRGTSASADTFDDKPKWSVWYDSKRRRIRINTHYHLEDGVWNRCVFTLAGELEESAPSVLIDDEGNPENPLILQSAYVDRDNDRYGIVRDMIPLQDEVNKRRSKFLHMVNSNRWRVSRTVGQDKAMVKTELAKPDAIVVADNGEIESLDQSSKDNGQFTLLQDTRATLKGNIGPNAYLQGKAGETQSGRAVLAQQQAGMTQMTPLLDNLRHFTIRLYRQIWNRIKQYWNAERWIRVTDDENNVRFVGLNRPPQIDPQRAMVAHQHIEMAKSQGLDEATAQQYHSHVEQMSKPQNVVGELDVDIEIDEINETPTLQAEQFNDLMQLVGTGVFGMPVPPEIAELIVAASNFRDKQKLFDIVEKMKQAAQQPNPMQDIALQDGQATVAEKNSRAMLNVAKAQKEGTPDAQAPVDPDAAQADIDETQSRTLLNMAKARHEAAKPAIEGFKAAQSLPPAA